MLCVIYIHLLKIPKNPGKRLRWTKAKIIDALASQEIINLDFSAELKMLVKYRNALVHGKDLTVPSIWLRSR
jgi:uncharacterized protein YutE (UPF0331/DUF86 family)